MNELLTTLGFVWRTIDGRGNDNPNPTPPYWNVYIYLGLLTILSGYVYLEYMNALQAFGIYAVVLTYLLTGYKSLTLPWVWYCLNKLKLKQEFEAYREGVIMLAGTEYFRTGYKMLNIKKQQLENLTEEYEKNNGFHTWHMAYRYVIAGCMLCAILDSWNAYYLLACSLAGASFPMRVRWWNTEASARLTEGLLGAVMMGWVWLI